MAAFFVFVLSSVILYGGKTDVIAFNQFIGDPVRIEVSGYFYDKTLDGDVSIKKVIKGDQVGGFKEICAKLDLEKIPKNRAGVFFQKDARIAARNYSSVVLHYLSGDSKEFAVLGASYI